MITDTGRLILSYLLEQDNDYISCHNLADLCNLSTGTIRSEITWLNKTLKSYKMSIDARQSQGFKLVADKNILENQDFEYLKYDLKRKLFNTKSKTYHNNYIIRRLLIANGYISQDKLCEELFISTSSLRRRISQTQKSLGRYKLSIKLKKNHGLYISGDEFNKRVYMLIQHKKIMHLDTKKQKLEQNFFNYFLSSSDYYKKFKDILFESLSDYPELEFSFINTPKLVNYLILCNQRHIYNKDIHFTDLQLKTIYSSSSYLYAKNIFEKLNKYVNYTPSEIDFCSFARLLIGYRTISSINQLPKKDRNEIIEKWTHIFNIVINKEGLTNALFNQETCQQFVCNMETIRNRIIMDTPFDLETYYPYYGISGIAADICCTLTKTIEEIQQITIDQTYIKSNLCLFNRIIENSNKSTINLKILVISFYGIEYARNIAMYLSNKYRSYIQFIETQEYFSKAFTNHENYDLILTDLTMSSMLLKDNVVYADFSNKTNLCTGFENILQNKIKDNLQCLVKDHIYKVSLKNKADVFNFITNIHKDKIITKADFISDLVKRDTCYNSARKNNMAFISTYNESLQESTLNIIINNHQIDWDGIKVKYFIFYYRNRNDFNSIYTLNQILSNLIKKTSNELEELVNSKDNIIDFLTPKNCY